MDQDAALHKLVRRSLSNSVLGRPYCDVALDLYQCILDGQPVPSKYTGRWVQPILEQIGADVAISFASSWLARPLDGLGIPSDIELFWDPVTVGSLFKATRGNIMITGAVASTPGIGNCSSALLLAMPAEGADGRGEAKFATLMRGLNGGASVSRKFLQKSLAIVAVDGQYARGEAQVAKVVGHNPQCTATILFEQLHRRRLVSWDWFHRLCKAGITALNKSNFACEFFLLLRDLEAAFNSPQGKMLDRQLHAFVGDRFLSGKVVSGTREFG